MYDSYSREITFSSIAGMKAANDFREKRMDTAIEKLSGIFPTMLKLAAMEKEANMLSDEIEKTRRRVNALEYVKIPQYQETIRYIKMKLDENERSSQIRLMKVKDMMLEEAHRYDEKNGGVGVYAVEIEESTGED